MRKLAAYLATVNLSRAHDRGSEGWNYELQTLPRPKGRATRVVITEYELPRATIAPHDVRTDAAGHVWYSNFVENDLGELDPKTGANRDYPIPVLKPGFPTGSLDLEADAEGNLWLALMFQTGLARFDMKTETFRIFPVDGALERRRHAVVDGDAALSGRRRQGLDQRRGAAVDHAARSCEPENISASIRSHFCRKGGCTRPTAWRPMPRTISTSWISPTRISAGSMPRPAPPRSIRRRPQNPGRAGAMLDDHGRLWFTEFAANKLAMFDIKAETFKEWDVPTPYTYPYDVFSDTNGELWSGGMASDRVLRFDPRSGRSVEYLLPRPTNIRRVFVDTSTKPVTFWAGNNHGAEIVRLEPLD